MQLDDQKVLFLTSAEMQLVYSTGPADLTENKIDLWKLLDKNMWNLMYANIKQE